ncbi:uncharacterized protein LOC122667541 isoform X2 [Telopea speciosissima]|uniref:uncharacterized protein LOC122667541 isoform X2 n=1 Tax=Telopea speciosissima TaxID=54955 RepID=UPI001CC46B27|nr:uncharacterized protein LOC122667541 isoform X2 [Telopea speciosissima]
MAIVTVDSSTHDLQFETISLVDLRLLSQSELNSLSLCSYEAFDLRHCDDVVISKIDRSVFNESSGSRKQTYSRLRLAPRKPEITNVGLRRRCAGLLPLPKPPPDLVDDPERKENQRIATLVQELFLNDNSVKTDLIPLDSEHIEPPIHPQPVPLKVENEFPLQQFPVVVSCKEVKKRGRKRKHELKPPQVQGDDNNNVMSNSIVVYDNGLNATKEQTMEIVNRNGVAVDIVALANFQDPFGPELRRRTVGLETETALLGFLKDLNGQWGSRRKKRKIVDASDFGDALPKGWKLLLTLKRREGRVWLNCRRYISPSGHQFVTCKEVSSFLLSYFGSQDSILQNFGHGDRNTQRTQELASQITAGLTCQEDNNKEDPICHSISPMIVHIDDHHKQVALLGVENLAEVQVRDLLECHKCNMTFEEKDAYLHHLLSSHQRSAKRCRIGSSISDGVIVKDGKYECQFCHKIFEERHRYNGHVGIHVRNYVRNLEVLPGPITVQKSIDPLPSVSVPSGVHIMGSSVYINKGSIPETSTAKPSGELNVGSVHCKLDVISTHATPAESNCEWMRYSSGSKQVTEADDKSSIPEVDDAKMNELNVGSLHSKLTATSILETPTSESICALNVDSSPSKQVAEAYKDSIPDTTAARLNDGQNIISFCTEQDPASILEPLPGAPKYELNVASQGNLVKEARKVCSTETSTAKSDYEQNAGSFHTKPEEVPIQETPTDESNFQPNVGTCHSKLITEANTDSVPEVSAVEFFDGRNVSALHNIPDETPSGKSNCDLNASSSHNKYVMEASKIEETLVENSYNKLSCDSKRPDSKSRMAGEANDVGNDKSCYCLDSGTFFCNQKDCSTFDTFDENDSYAVTSIKNDKCGIELERLSGSCSPTPGKEQICGLDGIVNEALTSVTEGPKLDKMDKSGNSELESGFSSCDAGPNKNVVSETTWTADKRNVPEDGVADLSLPLKQSSGSKNELGSGFGSCDAEPNKDVATEANWTADGGNVPEDGVVDSSLPLMQPSGCFPDPNMTLDKGADEFCNVKKLENMSGFEELRLDDTEPSRFSFMTGPESRSLPEKESMGFAYNSALGQELDSTVRFDLEAVSLIKASTNQPTTVCVWCRMEFNHEAVYSEMQSDSFGFMCLACRAKISGCNTTKEMQEG